MDNVDVIMVITLNVNAQLIILVSGADLNTAHLKAQGSWGRLSTIKGAQQWC